MTEPDGRRIQLIAAPEPSRREALLTGIGLLGGLFLGRSSLMAAVTGSERIDAALGHFVLVVLVCVGALLLLGRLVDQMVEGAPAAEGRSMEADTNQAVGAGDTTLVAPDEIG